MWRSLRKAQVTRRLVKPINSLYEPKMENITGIYQLARGIKEFYLLLVKLSQLQFDLLRLLFISSKFNPLSIAQNRAILRWLAFSGGQWLRKGQASKQPFSIAQEDIHIRLKVWTPTYLFRVGTVLYP